MVIYQEYQAIYVQAEARFIVAGDTKWPRALFEWNGIRLLGQPRKYQHYTNAPQYYAIRTLLLLLIWLSDLYKLLAVTLLEDHVYFVDRI